MPFINRLADKLAATRYGRNAVNEPADLGYFKQKPSFRLVMGLVFLVVSYIICWPAIALLTFLAAYYRSPLIIIIGGPLAYGLSWAVFGLSMLLLGIHSYYGASVIGHYFTRQFLEKYSSKGLEKGVNPNRPA